ncbi:hypothetical protein PX554_20025 [Sphingomonas sp. H39-1-10]|uniref:hypothetical protein n=1 Tax=Sphingomonas pollutisoli TaxID=3030829 RepID=UPI0023B8D36D|nr:hypothetical protein [Sphingomonas pollutisoli]MDF0490421.1 hypothetical protein [Sphingomonas pollutisoli]
MTDFPSFSSVQPAIPESDMTPLERLVLTAMFDHLSAPHGLQFYSRTGIREGLVLPLGQLRAAAIESHDRSPAAVNLLEAAIDLMTLGDGTIGFDLTAQAWETLFQDIVARSATIGRITILTVHGGIAVENALAAPGGSVTVITADRIAGKTLYDCLYDLEADLFGVSEEPPLLEDRSGPGDADIRAVIADMLRADDRLAPLAPGDVAEGDIRRARSIADIDGNDDEARCRALYDIARTAIAHARSRTARLR